MNASQRILDRCSGLTGTGRLAEAEVLVEGAVQEDPEDGRLWVALGLIRHGLGDHLGACQALETAGLLIPLEPEARVALADSFGRTGHPGLASEVYRGLSADPGCPDRLLPIVAAGLGQLGEYAPALGACLEMVHRSPELPEAHFGVAFYLRRLGRPAESVLPIVARAHELAPEVALYRISLATLLDHVGRRDEARELLRDLDFDSVSCRGCLRRMTTIFRGAGEPQG